VGLCEEGQAARGRGGDVHTAAAPESIAGTANPGLTAEGLVAGDGAVVQASRPARHVQAAPEAVTAVATGDLEFNSEAKRDPVGVAVAAVAADGLVVLDGAAVQRQRAAGAGGAAGAAPARTSG